MMRMKKRRGLTPSRCRDRRLELGLGQEEVARRAGRSLQQYAKIENSVEIGGVDPQLSTLVAIADALDSTMAELFDPAYKPATRRK